MASTISLMLVTSCTFRPSKFLGMSTLSNCMGYLHRRSQTSAANMIARCVFDDMCPRPSVPISFGPDPVVCTTAKRRWVGIEHRP